MGASTGDMLVDDADVLDVAQAGAAVLFGHQHAEEAQLAGLLHQLGRKELRLVDLDWNWDGDSLSLSFRLGRGAFATAVVRELVELTP